MDRTAYQQYLASREWALKREAVRKRANDECERCYWLKMDAVHHKTYERVGNERLEDLMAICNPCHEFLSGKTNTDPLTDGIAVYLAGPFAIPDWRLDIVTKPIDGSLVDRDTGFGKLRRGLPGGFDITGPWRVSPEEFDKHGLASGHGYGLCMCCDQATVVAFCQFAISRSNVVFAWLPTTDTVPAGTIWELGYAVAKGKPVVIAHDDYLRTRLDDYWFPLAGADEVIYAEDVIQAWERFVRSSWPFVRRQGILRASAR